LEGETTAAADTERFGPGRLTRPRVSGIDVVTTLRHFALVSYACDPERLAVHLHPRFVPDTLADGRALLSVVPFFDVDFRFAACPWPRFSFGQTNYRAYVVDRESGERAAWFFGTCLGSWTVAVPRHAWKLPWHRGRMRFDCAWSAEEERYERYRVETESDWSPASLELADSGEPVRAVPGFGDLEHGLVVLTHPLRGWFFRRDGWLGSYSVWHDRLGMSVGSCVRARFPLLASLGLVPLAEQDEPHSVLLQHETEFTIYLPPEAVGESALGGARG
jgi:hypothetical protein